MIEKLTDQEIDDFLKDDSWGHLGCNDGYNTYVYPINYLFDGKHIILHSQPGFKTKVMGQNPRISLQVDKVYSYSRWKSVMILGTYQLIEEERERVSAMKAFSERRLTLKINRPKSTSVTSEKIAHETAEISSRPLIYRILIDEKSGCYENGKA